MGLRANSEKLGGTYLYGFTYLYYLPTVSIRIRFPVSVHGLQS